MMLYIILFNFTPFYFIHYSDPQIGRNIYTVPHCSMAVHQIMAMEPQPAFIIVTGDMAEDPANQSNLLNQWRICDSLFDFLSISKYFTPGNRDIGYANDQYWTPARLELYRNFWGMDYYSVVYDSCIFINLNSTLLDTYSGHSCYPYSLQQDSFLRTTLLSASNSAYHIFLFHHFPLYLSSPTEPNSSNNVDRPRRDTLLKYLINYNIYGVFTGHLHYNLLNFYGPAMLMTALSTSETNINSCGYRVVKVYKNGIETFVIYLTAPMSSVSMIPIVQAQIQSETLYVNTPFSFSCVVDTINYPQWQGAIRRWIFRVGDTLYNSSGTFSYPDTGHYQILCQVYKSPHYSALYRFPVCVFSPTVTNELRNFSPVPFLYNTMGDNFSIYSPITRSCTIKCFSVDGRGFEIFSGILKEGINDFSFPPDFGTGVYFIRLMVSENAYIYKFIHTK